jgi:hypothetical protein
VIYVFLVERPGQRPSLAFDLTTASKLAGGDLTSDPASPGRFITADGTATATPYAWENVIDPSDRRLAAVS